MNSRLIKDNEALEGILALLKKNNLPASDLRLGDNSIISYHNDSNELIGSGGLEFYAGYSLLRSVAVEKTERGKALGKAIVADLIQRAKEKKAKEVYLLTETAHDFFLKMGFKDVSRDDVPGAIKASSEFSSVCPVSAACMVYKF